MQARRDRPIGHGFAIPAFFITSGMSSISTRCWATCPPCSSCRCSSCSFLVIRGQPALLLYREELPGPRGRAGLVLFSATRLPLVVAITTIGVDGEMRESTASARVGAAMLSTLIFPLLGTRVVRAARD